MAKRGAPRKSGRDATPRRRGGGGNGGGGTGRRSGPGRNRAGALSRRPGGRSGGNSGGKPRPRYAESPDPLSPDSSRTLCSPGSSGNDLSAGEDLRRSDPGTPQVFQGGDPGDIPSFLRRYVRTESRVDSVETTPDGGTESVERSRKKRSQPRNLREGVSGSQRVGERRPGETTVKKSEGRGKTGKKAKSGGMRRVRAPGKRGVDAGNPADRSAELPGRLQKVLAAAGLGARRQCEELIASGRVEVDRKVVTELGTRVDPTAQEIRVDGVVLPRLKPEYYALHKPRGVVTTSSDPSGRTRVLDLIPSEGKHLFAVGRLDMSSEGLILVTSDGDWADRITHPRYGVEKTYRVVVEGTPERSTLAQLERGVWLAEGLARVKRVTFRRRMKNQSILEIVLNEGRNREIRRVLAKVGHKVHRLVRIAVGPIRLGDLPV
ncbi:MAG: pseudouridine synthase, partial [Planctomycetia bacterium]|nr:pseudouridine synthase [Planctomycetia bacterium]